MITSYKNRIINLDKKVEVYRCLNRKGFIFSVKQDGLVIGHTENLTLRNVKFHINQNGWGRCNESQNRNVHAFLVGEVSENYPKSIDFKEFQYNPYCSLNGFYDVKNLKTIEHADWVRIVADDKKLYYL